jgi:hypothetical protein
MHAKLIEILEEKKPPCIAEEPLFSAGIRDFKKALTSNDGIDPGYQV